MFDNPMIPKQETLNVVRSISQTLFDCLSLVLPNLPSQIVSRRASNVIKIVTTAKQKLDNAGLKEDEYRQCALKLGLPLLEKASLEEDPKLQDLWANLLANALNSNVNEKTLRTVFISIISELTPFDVAVLKLMYDLRSELNGMMLFPLSSGALHFDKYKNRFNDDYDTYIGISLDNLERLQIVRFYEEVSSPTYNQLSSSQMADMMRTRRLPRYKQCPEFTHLGLAFVKACIMDAGNANCINSPDNQ